MDFQLSVSPRKEIETAGSKENYLDVSANRAHDLRIISNAHCSIEGATRQEGTRSFVITMEIRGNKMPLHKNMRLPKIVLNFIPICATKTLSGCKKVVAFLFFRKFSV